MVPSAIRDAGQGSTPDPPEEEPDHSPTQAPRGGAPTSRVDYLQQRYKDCQVSEGATKLLLAS